MVHDIHFRYRNKTYAAKVILSLEEDGCYVFAFLQCRELIEEFGRDIDITTDGRIVLSEPNSSKELNTLKTAILEVVKLLDDLRQFKLRKLVIRKEQLN